MITKEMVARINELAHKSKTEGLNGSEKEEQQELRAAYLAAIRENVISQLSQIRFVEDEAKAEEELEVEVSIDVEESTERKH